MPITQPTQSPSTPAPVSPRTYIWWSAIVSFIVFLVVYLSAVLGRAQDLPYDPIVTHTLLMIPLAFVLCPYLVQRRYQKRGVAFSGLRLAGMTVFIIASLALALVVLDFIVNGA